MNARGPRIRSLRSPDGARGDDIEPSHLRRFPKPTVIGQDSISIKANGSLQMQGIKSAQILHRQEACGSIRCTVEGRQRHTLQECTHFRLVPTFPHRHATQFGLKKITRDKAHILAVKPIR